MSGPREVRWTPAETSLHAAGLTFLQVRECVRRAQAAIGLGLGLQDPEATERALAMKHAKRQGWGSFAKGGRK